MASLYKYLPPERIDVLECLSIRISPLKSLNDPFEQVFNLDLSEARRAKAESLCAQIKDYINQISDMSKEDKLNVESAFLKEFEKSWSDVSGSYLADYLGDEWGILSLSRTKENLLMWSHYAKNATGFVIGFNRHHSFLNRQAKDGRCTTPIPVIYGNSKPSVKPLYDSSTGSSRLDGNWQQDLLCNKPIDWAYEQEERLMFTLIFGEGFVKRDDNKQRIFLDAIPKDSISEIYIGPLASDETKSRITAVVDKHGLTCKLYFANLSRDSYQLEFIESKMQSQQD